LANYAPLYNPALTGVPTAPTAAAGTSTTQIATTAFAITAGLGWNQTWQNVTSSRAANTTYTNSTGKPIMVSISVGVQGVSEDGWFLYVSGIVVAEMAQNTAGLSTGINTQLSAIVPNGATYSLVPISSGEIGWWVELR